MKVTIFTCNQPRHLAFIESVASVASSVNVIQEVSTIFPGMVADFFKKSAVMQDYFSYVLQAEKEIFGSARILKGDVHHLAIRAGDLNNIPLEGFGEALDADLFLVFGGSFIRGPLCDFLISKQALNIHMGVSPFYRGSSCNFWALYDNRPEYVGATIHEISKGLDSGAILFHAFPKPQKIDGFLLGMLSVRVAQQALVERIRDGSIGQIDGVIQDPQRLIRYTRNAEFTDEIASEYLERRSTPDQIFEGLQNRSPECLVRPVLF